MSKYLELYIDQGTDFVHTLVLNDTLTNANVNISGYSITSKVKKSYYASNATANLVCTITDAANGVFNISLDSANTSNIRGGRYLFDIIYDTGSLKDRTHEGHFIVNPRITE